ncbi:uncharacterized protein LOC125747369 [Brienomyrus brachyistius]|uniref:uncharacterized protein LOC125747369 n=1 Tax=Brienomyrus brachyistius TaxID=42636 RepID=UPI0020B1FC21|nr:uncharacterized protein LOC125747369 [Brienomyrus brachyistius]
MGGTDESVLSGCRLELIKNNMANSAQLEVIERAVLAGVRAALNGIATQAGAASSTSSTVTSDGSLNQISKEDIENLLSLSLTLTEVASVLVISRPTLYKYMQEYNIPQSKFSSIPDEELDAMINQIKSEHPHAGEVMLNGHLRSRGIIVQRRRLRESVKRIDGTGLESRRRTAVHRRVYAVPCPNYIWHVDGNHKLIRWKLVVHGAMDGYSRMLMFLRCSNNNRAETVKDLFSTAVSEFGRPLHVRTDHGGENVQIWQDMRLHRGETSVLTGNSVHNQRIERFNRDLNRNCSHVYAPIFYELESMEALNVENETDLFSLHFVYIPRLNRTLDEFKDAFNNHSISSEGNRTPVQLYTVDRHLLFLNNPDVASEERTVNSTSTMNQTSTPSHMNYSFSPLNEQGLQELFDTVNPLDNDGNNGKTLFLRVQEFVFNKIMNEQ